jgi:hypothetical protein
MTSFWGKWGGGGGGKEKEAVTLIDSLAAAAAAASAATATAASATVNSENTVSGGVEKGVSSSNALPVKRWIKFSRVTYGVPFIRYEP